MKLESINEAIKLNSYRGLLQEFQYGKETVQTTTNNYITVCQKVGKPSEYLHRNYQRELEIQTQHTLENLMQEDVVWLW